MTRDSSAQRETRHTGAYNVVEWIIVIVSTVVLLAVAAYLVISIGQTGSPYVSIQIEVQTTHVKRHSGRIIVPVKVTNKGRRSLSSWSGQAHFRYQGVRHTITLSTTYLVPDSPATFYLALPARPRKLGLQITTTNYVH